MQRRPTLAVRHRSCRKVPRKESFHCRHGRSTQQRKVEGELVLTMFGKYSLRGSAVQMLQNFHGGALVRGSHMQR